jgi:hypothetical protein
MRKHIFFQFPFIVSLKTQTTTWSLLHLCLETFIDICIFLMVMKYEQLMSSFASEGRLPCTQNNNTQCDQKVFMHLVITIKLSGAQRLFDHPV